MRRAVWLTSAVAVLAIFATLSHAQTNSWIGPSVGSWEKAKNWDNDLPSVTQSAVIITNANNAAVTIDSHTAHKSDSLTISNLNIAALSGGIDTLFLDNTGTIALHVLNGLLIGLGINMFGGEGVGVGEAALISTNSTLIIDGLLGGELEDDGTMVFTGGSLITTNCTLKVGSAINGLLIISNGVLRARDVTIQRGDAVGIIEVIGGTMTVSSSLNVGDVGRGANLLVANGALLVATNADTRIGGSSCNGNITVSNATFLAASVGLGGSKSVGELVIDDGTVTLSGALVIGSGDICSGSVSMNGGLLVVTNSATVIPGDNAEGSMTVEDGLFLAREILVGTGYMSGGNLTINGGITQLSSYLQVGRGGLSDGSVNVNGGQLVVTNGDILLGSDSGISVSGGLLAARYIDDFGGSFIAGVLSVSGGSVTASTGITLGDCTSGSVGQIFLSGGQLIVTNAAYKGFIDVQNGEVVLSNGVLQVDELVMTNTCSSFAHTGGTLIVGSVILDPNAFQITSVARQGNDMLVTWLMAPGATNALQVAAGGSHGSYNTNSFTDIFIVTNNTIAGSLTNYLDIGAATNIPSRYYRARLAP